MSVLANEKAFLEIVSNGVDWYIVNHLDIYKTAWTANSDWTNADLPATHNLDQNLSDLIVKFYISSDAAGANAFIAASSGSYDSGTAVSKNLKIQHISDDQINIQTAVDGILTLNDSGVVFTVDTESWYYKIVVISQQL